MTVKRIMWNDLINWGMVMTPIALTCILGWRTELANEIAFQFGILLALVLLVIWLIWLQFKWHRLIQLSRLPWYIVIGYAGSGKATLLQNSGLREVSASQGPCKYLDPLLRKKTTTLEGTGVYITHDMADTNRDEWLDLLTRLRKFFRGSSLSGILVTVGADEINNGWADEQQAQRISERLDDLSEQLNVRPPVYLLCTKSDLLDGFVPFFDDLSHSLREQPWGTTLTKVHQQDPSRAFAFESQLLYQALDNRRLTRVASTAIEDRQATYHFPMAFQNTYQQLQLFVDTLFRIPADYEGFLFRGFYCTGVTPPDAADARSVYFTKGLFTDIIHRDQMVAQPTARVDRQRWFNRMAMSVGAFVFAAILPLYTQAEEPPLPMPTVMPIPITSSNITSTIPSAVPSTIPLTPIITSTNMLPPTAVFSNFIVGVNLMNVRENPWGKVIGQANKNQQFMVKGQTKEWWQITWGKGDGWLYKSLGNVAGPVANIPIVQVAISTPPAMKTPVPSNIAPTQTAITTTTSIPGSTGAVTGTAGTATSGTASTSTAPGTNGATGATTAPTAAPAPPDPPLIIFGSDASALHVGECTKVFWTVKHVKEVYYRGQGVDGVGSREECMKDVPEIYSLTVVLPDGAAKVFTTTIKLISPTVTPTPLPTSTPDPTAFTPTWTPAPTAAVTPTPVHHHSTTLAIHGGGRQSCVEGQVCEIEILATNTGTTNDHISVHMTQKGVWTAHLCRVDGVCATDVLALPAMGPNGTGFIKLRVEVPAGTSGQTTTYKFRSSSGNSNGAVISSELLLEITVKSG